MARLIEDYGMIGDGETAALVQRNGSIDWLCWPRFDSDACFAALLGTAEHGCWKIAPADAYESDRRYQSGTLILETDHKTTSGVVRVVEFMPIREHSSVLIRIVTGVNTPPPKGGGFRLRLKAGSVRHSADSDALEIIVWLGWHLVSNVLHPDLISDVAAGRQHRITVLGHLDDGMFAVPNRMAAALPSSHLRANPPRSHAA